MVLARKAVTRSGRGYRGRFPSRKLGRMVAWESPLERDVILHLEFSPGVVRFQEQPEKVTFWAGDEFSFCYPDFRLELRDGRHVRLEVKASEKLDKPEVAEKYRWVAIHYAQQGENFRLVTEREARREPLLGNLKTLRPMLRREPKDESWKKLLPEIMAGAELPVSEVTRRIGCDGALRLIAHQVLFCDLTEPLTGNNPVRLFGGAHHDEILL